MAKTKLEFVCRECGASHPKARLYGYDVVVKLDEQVFSSSSGDIFC
ncbi:hypothetical protein SPONN_285 [uncultured Candidatus Thioglobus sp.]|nr:hypothetical protein SPONN_285 [uncultured Candidatus Thioglobus sp.]